LSGLAATYAERGLLTTARALQRASVELHRRLEPQIWEAGWAELGLARLELLGGDVARARPLVASAEARVRAAIGESHPAYAPIPFARAELAFATGRYEAAEADLRRALGLMETERSPLRLDAWVLLGRTLLATGRPMDAASRFRATLAEYRSVLPAGHWRIAQSEALLGECLAAMGDREQAEGLLATASERLERSLGSSDPRTAAARERLRALQQPLILSRADTVSP
jgi:tetratricopeptide (TPR) repeat protein